MNKGLLFALLFSVAVMAAGGDTLTFDATFEAFSDGDTIYADAHFHAPHDSTKAVINGRLGNANLAADAEIAISKLDTAGYLRIDSVLVKSKIKGSPTVDSLSGGTHWSTSHITVSDSAFIDTAAVNVIRGNVKVADSVYAAKLESPSVNIDGGAIDGATIGASTAAAGTFTTANATSLTVSDSAYIDTLTTARLRVSDSATISGDLSLTGILDIAVNEAKNYQIELANTYSSPSTKTRFGHYSGHGYMVNNTRLNSGTWTQDDASAHGTSYSLGSSGYHLFRHSVPGDSTLINDMRIDGPNDLITAYHPLTVEGTVTADTVTVSDSAYAAKLASPSVNIDGGAIDGAVIGANSAAAGTFTTVNTGQGNNELYDMNQNVQTTDNVTFATVNTGQGANELYDMNQNVTTTSDVTFATAQADSFTTNGSDYFGYEESFFVAEFLGFSTNPTDTIWYSKTGNRVTMTLPDISGTSNASTFLIESDSIPASLVPTRTQYQPIGFVTDNGTIEFQLGSLIVNSTAAADWALKRAAGPAWTTSGTKGVDPCTIVYDLR